MPVIRLGSNHNGDCCFSVPINRWVTPLSRLVGIQNKINSVVTAQMVLQIGLASSHLHLDLSMGWGGDHSNSLDLQSLPLPSVPNRLSDRYTCSVKVKILFSNGSTSRTTGTLTSSYAAGWALVRIARKVEFKEVWSLNHFKKLLCPLLHTIMPPPTYYYVPS